MEQHEEIAVTMDVRLDVRVAGLGSRALAQFIDWLLLQLVQFVLGIIGVIGVVVFVGTTGIQDSGTVGWMLAGMVLLNALLTAGWFLGYELAWDGQTPGKRWLGLRVVAEDGGAADATAIVIRNLVRLVDFLPFGFLSGLISILVTRNSRRLGDLAAGTLVVVEERAPAKARRIPEGTSDADARLVEAYFARAPALWPRRREELAAKLLTRLGRAPEPGRSAEETLAAAFPEGP